jgi:hypothetical protein
MLATWNSWVSTSAIGFGACFLALWLFLFIHHRSYQQGRIHRPSDFRSYIRQLPKFVYLLLIIVLVLAAQPVFSLYSLPKISDSNGFSIQDYRLIYIQRESVNIYSEPSANSSSLGFLKPTDTFNRGEKKDGYVLIRAFHGQMVGWVSQDEITPTVDDYISNLKRVVGAWQSFMERFTIQVILIIAITGIIVFYLFRFVLRLGLNILLRSERRGTTQVWQETAVLFSTGLVIVLIIRGMSANLDYFWRNDSTLLGGIESDITIAALGIGITRLFFFSKRFLTIFLCGCVLVFMFGVYFVEGVSAGWYWPNESFPVSTPTQTSESTEEPETSDTIPSTEEPETVIINGCVSASSSLRVRSGPGTEYLLIGGLTSRDCVGVDGRDKTGEWYRINEGNESELTGGWVSATYIRLNGNPKQLPIVP